MDPAAFGDPEYQTKKAGGTVYHAILGPFLVHYVVFEVEKAVFLLRIRLV